MVDAGMNGGECVSDRQSEQMTPTMLSAANTATAASESKGKIR